MISSQAEVGVGVRIILNIIPGMRESLDETLGFDLEERRCRFPEEILPGNDNSSKGFYLDFFE